MFYSPCVSRREFVVPCLVLRPTIYGNSVQDTELPGTCKVLGDWMRRVPGRKRLVTDTTTESARDTWNERCGALTPISCGEKFESVTLPTASARKETLNPSFTFYAPLRYSGD